MLASTLEQVYSPSLPGRKSHARCLSISCTLEIMEVIEGILAAVAREGFPREDRFALRLTLEEAIVNAIKHGHKYDSSMQVQVRYRVNARRVLVEITDQGAGYDPRQVPDPVDLENLEKSSGRGLLLMRAYMTWIRLNQRGNRVVLCKKRSRF